jgi:glycosyltransferase involved in cell wall biosynthesis
MHRICGSLANAGYDVTLVGRQRRHSPNLEKRSFHQKRLSCFFQKGFSFYAEYNLRLFFFLLFKKIDAVCAIDLDTILPCLFVSKLKGTKRIYDAHEYFTELKEVRTRPRVKKVWLGIERFSVPRFRYGYTVSEGLAQAFEKNYQRKYEVIRNFPVLTELPPAEKKEPFIIFQGAVNEARGFEYLVPALRSVPYNLVVCGNGNFMDELKKLVALHGVKDRVELKGMMRPQELQPLAQQATLGIGLAEKEGINQFYALPNKFLEYMHAGLPQIAMDYPEYKKINDQYKVAVLLDQLSVEVVSQTINEVMSNKVLLDELHKNALKAREIYCWQNEEQKLIGFYKNVFDEG